MNSKLSFERQYSIHSWFSLIYNLINTIFIYQENKFPLFALSKRLSYFFKLFLPLSNILFNFSFLLIKQCKTKFSSACCCCHWSIWNASLVDKFFLTVLSIFFRLFPSNYYKKLLTRHNFWLKTCIFILQFFTNLNMICIIEIETILQYVLL